MPAAAVKRRGQALFIIIGRKEYVDVVNYFLGNFQFVFEKISNGNKIGDDYEVGGITNVKVKFYDISTNTKSAGCFLWHLTLRY